MKSSVLAVAVIAIISLSTAFAQTPPAQPAPVQPSPPITRAPVDGTTTVPVPRAPGADGKRVVCRRDIAAKGIRGQDARDQMQLCMAQGQLDCVRQAIDQKVVGPQRQDFMKTCMGRRIGGER